MADQTDPKKILGGVPLTQAFAGTDLGMLAADGVSMRATQARGAVDEALRGLSHYVVNFGYLSEDPIAVETWGPYDTASDG